MVITSKSYHANTENNNKELGYAAAYRTADSCERTRILSLWPSMTGGGQGDREKDREKRAFMRERI